MAVFDYWRLPLSTVLWLVIATLEFDAGIASPVISQANSSVQNSAGPSSSIKPCPKSAVLSRLARHTAIAGETIEGLARQYNLIPATLMGLNPVLRQGIVPAGAQIVIPPYNGILVEVPPGQTLREVATTYRVRPDVLFEVNGCQLSPKLAFVPGINWSPVTISESDRSEKLQTELAQPADSISRYPLPFVVSITSGYGWRVHPIIGQVTFHSGVDLEAPTGTSVMAVANGTVAFAGNQGNYGNLVVVNHLQGYQTRYAQLATIAVSVGQVINQGTTLGTVGMTGLADRPHLHFEIRSNSAAGWVAQDPTSYLRGMKVARREAPGS